MKKTDVQNPQHTRIKRRNRRSEGKKPQFLEAYGKIKTISGACRAINICRNVIAAWRDTDPAFAAAMDEADLEITEKLEAAADMRAISGSDQLLMFLLKARNRSKYGERIRHEFTTKTLDLVVDEVLRAIRAKVPDFCPHCNTALEIAPELAKELMRMSATLAGKPVEEAVE